MPQELEAVALQMQPGEVSEVLGTEARVRVGLRRPVPRESNSSSRRPLCFGLSDWCRIMCCWVDPIPVHGGAAYCILL